MHYKFKNMSKNVFIKKNLKFIIKNDLYQKTIIIIKINKINTF